MSHAEGRERTLFRRLSAIDAAGELQHTRADADAAIFNRTQVHVESNAAVFDHEVDCSTHIREAPRLADRDRVGATLA